MFKRLRNQRGAALLETAITIPLVLLISVSIFAPTRPTRR
jgi:Flp pilus assembly protein TadG